MKRALAILAGLAVLAGAGFYGLSSPALIRAGTEPVAEGAPDLANGKVVFAAGGCASCHATPDQPDGTRLGGGLALKTPFGTFHPPNISPDPADGIGGWTLAAFQRAMRGGVAPDGRHLYPSFPYTTYQRMADADIRDLFGYIKSLTAVQGRAPGHDLSFPFNMRRGLGLWKLMFLDGKPFVPDPSWSPERARGAYLVEAMAHCAECHSPRNALGAIVADKRFSGGPDPEGKGFIPNITTGEGGIKDWSKADVAEMLKTGFTPTFDSVGGSMGKVVKNTAQLSDADRAAIADYILSRPPLPKSGG